jgi:hypothetical protein
MKKLNYIHYFIRHIAILHLSPFQRDSILISQPVSVIRDSHSRRFTQSMASYTCGERCRVIEMELKEKNLSIKEVVRVCQTAL